EAGKRAVAAPTPARVQSPPRDAARPPRSAQPKPLDPLSVSLATVRQVSADPSKAVGGMVSLTVRSPLGAMERDWLAEQGAASVPFPLLPLGDGVPLEPLAVPDALSDRAWIWPSGALGEVKFSPMTPLPGPRRSMRASSLLPSLVLLESALGKRALNESFVL